MLGQKELNTREFLRNFKLYKNMLLDKKVDRLLLPIEEGKILEIHIKQSENSASNIANIFRRLPKKIIIDRPRIFDELDPTLK